MYELHEVMPGQISLLALLKFLQQLRYLELNLLG
jgi:hypothetical protein